MLTATTPIDNNGASGVLEGTLVIPPDHPLNPYRHRYHPEHREGYEITREIKLEFGATDGGGGASTGGAPATGGADATGGTTETTGGQAAGGAATGGAADATGGAADGAGGAGVAAGGSTATGGSAETGGSTNVETTPTTDDSGAVTCPDALTLCGTVCVDLATHTSHCGACDRACAAGQTCISGVCTDTATCQPPLVECAGACVNTSTDPAHCGRCDLACAAGEVCSAGVCSSQCGPGLTQCGLACVDQSADILNCGGCGVVCREGQQCTNGQCTGTPTGGDPTVPTAAATDPSAAPTLVAEQDGGCGCSMPGRTNTPSAWLLTVLGGVVAWVLGRRRR